MIFKRGLVVGKFCPLHRGHQLVIETALRQCDEVVIISYAKPGFAGYEAARREKWLAALYPSATLLVIDDDWFGSASHYEGVPYACLPHDDAPAEVHRIFCGWLCWKVLGRAVDAVFTSEDYGDGFAETLSYYFRIRLPGATRVQHVMVDRNRLVIPISGTRLREDLLAHRAFVDDRIYASLIKRVAFLGGESTGKSTLTRALGEHLRTTWVAEYGRELWEERTGALGYDDLLVIGRTQVRREEQACLNADRWVFCDTTPLTTLFYCADMFGKVEPELEALAGRPYDYLFLCAPDFEFVQDGTRQNPQFRDRQHAWYIHQLDRLGMPYQLLTGSIKKRIETVIECLRQ